MHRVSKLGALALAGAMALASTTVHAAEPAPSEAPTADPNEPTPPPLVTPFVPPPKAIEPDPRNYRLVLAGNIVIGLGGAALISMIVGLGLRSEAIDRRKSQVISDAGPEDIARQDRRISTGTTLAIAGGAATAALFATGITLIAVGHRRERRRRVSLPAVKLGPRGAGVSWSLRF